MDVEIGNIFSDLALPSRAERFTDLVAAPHLKIERIVSMGQATPPDIWLDQHRDEWVILLAGAAKLMFEGEAAPRALKAGDYIHIPAHRRHRVEWTRPNEPTIWLAVHYAA